MIVAIYIPPAQEENSAPEIKLFHDDWEDYTNQTTSRQAAERWLVNRVGQGVKIDFSAVQYSELEDIVGGFHQSARARWEITTQYCPYCHN